MFDQKYSNIFGTLYNNPSRVYILEKSFMPYVHKLNEIISYELIFRDIYSKSKYCHIFAHIAKCGYEYLQI